MGRQNHSPPPPSTLYNHFFGFQIRARNLTPFRTLKIHQIRPKMPQKPSPRPSQNASKTASHLTMPEILKNATLPYENLIFDVSRPSKIVPKSMPKRLQNQLYLGYPLGTLKNTIFDVKTSPRWIPKISDFFQKSSKNPSSYGLWPKMPLKGFQEASKTLPKASKSHPRASKSRPRASQEPPKSPQEAPDS